MLHHSDFYRAAVSDCGCHDNRMDKIWWNEAWMGWPVGPWYAANSNVTHAGKLRGAIAVQSLREALEIVTADEHPELWESATLNLANALQHLPSAHPGQNMLESIELYGQVLERRSEATLARARTLASKANALAHLGRYDEVRPMLVEAKSIFEQSRDAAGLAGIDAIEAEMLACPASVGEASHG